MSTAATQLTDGIDSRQKVSPDWVKTEHDSIDRQTSPPKREFAGENYV